MGIVQSNKLTKEERLTSKVLIEKLFRQGKSIFSFPIKLVYLPLDEGQDDAPAYLFGVTVPKRLHRKAHERNLLKRRIREAYRKNKPPIIKRNGKVLRFAFMYICVDRNISDYDLIVKAIKKLHKKIHSKSFSPLNARDDSK